MQRLRKNISVLSGFRLAPLMVLAWACLAASVGRAQPANDDFANAQDLGTAGVGSVTGDNINATEENGEQFIFGVQGGQSVWYTWTALADGPVTFTSVGGNFDSLLGVYTGPTVDNQTIVGEGFDLISFGFSQPVSFLATAGTTYNISVDGYLFGIPQGNLVLSWTTNTSGAMAAGDFAFTSSFYPVAENENAPTREAHMLTVGPRLTITRTGGHDGRVLVSYSVTNGFYTNIVNYAVTGTNVTTIVSQGGVPISTNIDYTTNIVARYQYQDDQWGQILYLGAFWNWTNIVGTSVNGTNIQTVTFSNNIPVDPAFPCANLSLGSSTTTDTNAIPPITTFVSTNIFCLRFSTNQVVDSAVPNLDYIPISGTLVFDDFQMSKDIFLTVFPSFNPFVTTNSYIVNRTLFAQITDVQLDPLETTAISPPTTNTTLTTAIVNILDQDTQVFGEGQNNTGGGFGTAHPGVNIINLASTTLRCTESVNGIGTASVAAERHAGDAKSVTVQYRIDFYYPYNLRNDAFRSVPRWETPLQAGSDYATPEGAFFYSANVDFTPVSGTLTWGAGDVIPKLIQFPINNDSLVEFNEDILVQIWEPNTYTDASVGYVSTCNLTILFDDQPAGAIDRSFNPDNNANTQPPYNLHPGPNNTVYAIDTQPDGKIIIGGDFTAYNTVPRNRIARANVDGSLDTSFDPADGADGFVSAAKVDSSGKIVIGGAFSSINRISRNRIARLNADGSLDTTFTPGLGADGTVWTMGFHSSGNIYVAGEFTTINSTNRVRIARLNPDGTLDPTFDPGVGPNGTVLSLNVQPDAKVIIAGEFTAVDGVVRGHIARLNEDGTLDTSFDPGQGFNDVVFSTALQNDGKVLAGGGFGAFQQYSQNFISRLNSDGSLDLNFDVGSGPDDDVYTLALQPDSTILVGGIFKSINQTRRIGIARLLSSGLVDTTFMDTAYNQFAGIPTHYFDPGVEPPNFIYAIAVQPSGGVLIVGSFPRVGGGNARDDIRNRSNFARLIGGSTPGPGNIELAYPSYTADQSGQSLFITMNRINGNLGQAAVGVRPDPLPTGPGAAVDGADFTFDLNLYGTPTWITTWAAGGNGTWQVMDALWGQNNGFSPSVDPNTSYNDSPPPAGPNNDVYITILDNTNVIGNRSLNLQLSHPSGTDLNFLGGENIPVGVALGRSAAPLTIIDPHTLPGVLGFSSPTYTVSEGTNAVITVTRTNGSTGLVTVQFATANGTATNLIHYRPASGRLTFNPGETAKTFTVTNIDESIKEGDHTILLRLFNPSVATLGLSNAVITVIDNDIVGGYVEFSSATFATNENAGTAFVRVNRQGGGAGTLTVQFAATNGTAIKGVNYTAFTNTLTWANNDVLAKTVAIPIFDDGVVNVPDLTVNLRLFSPTLNSTNNPLGLGNTNTAVLTLINSDFRGQVGFSTANYAINENGGPSFITVVRSGGAAETISVNFNAATGTATAGTDYIATNRTLIFGPGEVSKTTAIPIIDNGNQDPPRTVSLILSGASPANSLGSLSNSTLTIIDDESFNQPPGGPDTGLDPSTGLNDAVHALALQSDAKLLVAGDFTVADGVSRRRMARLNADGSLDSTFSSTSATAGANDSILAMVIQTDKRILLGGRFTTMNSVNRNYLARINFSGSIDSTFNPGSGPDNTVFTIAETFDGANRKVLVGGAFTTFNSAPVAYLVRLRDNGTMDSSFVPGLGPNGAVYSIAMQPDGKAVIAGDFTIVNSIARNHIARLNADGSLDLSFNPGSGTDASVRALAVQLDGRVLLGGLFTNVNGFARGRIARLNANGSVDVSFNPGLGANEAVASITVQPDTRIVVGGQFTLFNGVTRNRLTRLNNDGSQDTKINFGSGLDNYVDATLVQTNDMIVMGGGFTQYDGQPHPHIARIYGGTINGAGAFEFTSADYGVTENSSNVVVTVRRRGGTTGDPGNVSVSFATSDGTAVANTNYLAVNANLVFPPGEVFQTVSVPILDDFVITPDLTVNLTLTNPLPADAGGPALGNQPTSIITISNIDSDISFSADAYFRNEDALDGVATIPIVRNGSTLGAASVTFSTIFGGTAIPGLNYVPQTNVVNFAAGQSSNVVKVGVLHDPLPTGNKTVFMQLSTPNNALLFNPSEATLTIVDVDHGPGQFILSQAAATVSEGGGFIPITVVRSNGYSGQVSVNFATTAGTATPGSKYIATNGSLSFADGETSKSFNVQILEDNVVTGNQTFSVDLSAPTGGTTLGTPSSEVVTIVEDDIGVSFSSSLYVTSENVSNLTLTVLRPYGTNTVSQVAYATTNGTAVAGVNYIAASGQLTFNLGETFKNVNLTVLHDPGVATTNLSFAVNLLNPVNAQVVSPGVANVLILDAEAGLSFTTNSTTVFEDGTNVVLAVVCSNPNVEPIFVHYATADGTSANPGFAGVDFTPVSGTLSFTNGITTNFIVVSVIDNLKVDGNRDFSVNLSSPTTPGVLVAPISETVTILDNDSGLSFSSSGYDVFKNGVSATIGVVRTGYTNSIVSVSYATSDGTATNGQDYTGTSGTLIFSNGVTSGSFNVGIIDSTVVKPNRTVVLTLSSPVGNASLGLPNPATLTIHDNSGSLIVPAGAVMTNETFNPKNGVIEPGETVTLLFGLRNAGGTNTANLVATLLTTNGITSPSGAQSYGSLVVDGPSASRSFSFTASGTNGQTITATFRLQDGAIDRGTALFSYVLGNSSRVVTNGAVIVINDNTNATPYPSTINVSGLGGSISKVTVTLTNVNHFFPADIAAMLLSPGGQKVLLMANSGSAPMQNVTLTFDDAAATALPQSGAIASGSYRLNGVTLVTTFPFPAPPAPYSTNLSVFNNSNPNGLWSLFVLDDSPGSSGAISNGWSLNLTTLNPVAAASDLVVGVAVTNVTTVSNLVYRVNVGYNITVTNFGPAAATNVSVSDIFPTNATLVSASPAGYTVVSNILTFTNLGTLAKDAFTRLNVTISVPAVPSVVSNTVTTVAGSPTDPNLANNTVTTNIAISNPVSDVSLTMSGAPNPMLLGDTLQYSLQVSNNINFAPAANVKLTNTLSLAPPVQLLSNVPPAESVSGNIIIFNLGVIPPGGKTNIAIYVRPLAAGSVTNNAAVGSALTDPFKVNNTASVKTLVEQLAVSLSGHNVVLSWPTDVGAYALMTATNLHSPNWTLVTNQAQNLLPGFNTVTLGTTNSSRFFRLQKL